MSKHTAGPWEVLKNSFNRTEDEGKYLLGSIYSRAGFYVATIESVGGEEEANALLIAAAPEMYEVLKYATRELEASGLCFDHPTIVKLNALLARIEGENHD